MAKSTLRGAAQAQVEFNPRVDLTAAHRIPGRAGSGDRAESASRADAIHADDQRQGADADRRGIEFNGRELRTFDAQQRDVGGGVAADDLRWPGLSAGSDHRCIAFFRQRLI